MARILSGTLTFDNAINFGIHKVIVQIWKRDSEHDGNSVYIRKAFGKSIISHSEFHELKSSFSSGSLISISMYGDNLLPLIANHLIISKSIFKGAQKSTVDIWLQDIRSFFVEISDSCITANEGRGLNFATDHSTAKVHVTNCIATHNMHGGLYLEINTPIPKIQIVIENTEISNNIRNEDGGAGIAMIMQEKVKSSTFIVLRNVSFVRNEHNGVKWLTATTMLVFQWQIYWNSQFTSTSHFFLAPLDSCYTVLNTDVCATPSWKNKVLHVTLVIKQFATVDQCG